MKGVVKIVKKPTFTDAHVHGAGCVHVANGEMCGKPSMIKQHGWLCWEHERKCFPIPQRTEEVQ